MPFLIRIILQRILIFVYSILAFLGLSPEAQIPDPDRANEIIEERREAFSNILEEESSVTEDVLEEINNKIPDIIKDIDITPDPIEEVSNEPAKLSVTNPLEGVSEVVAGDNLSSVKNVVLNTVCIRQEGNKINVSTGSGVLVSPEGVVLTNAHVAQFFIIQDYDDNIIDCSLYRENIPTFGYKAEVLYISPDWIFENYELISAQNAVGTGEEDYAFLYITRNTNPALPIPLSFPHADIDTNTNVDKNDPVIVAGYPGAPTSLIEVSSAGNLQIDSIDVDDVFTFGSGDIDIITTEKTFVGAKGSSGGGVFLGQDVSKATLVGTISTTHGTSGNAQINAITTSYINRDLLNDTARDINYYLQSNLEAKSNSFKNIYLENLAELLLSAL